VILIRNLCQRITVEENNVAAERTNYSTFWGKFATNLSSQCWLHAGFYHKQTFLKTGTTFTISQIRYEIDMYRFDIIGRWNVVKGVLKQRYNMLTDEDLTFRTGHEGELINRLQSKLGKSRADIMRIIGEC
jgi:hypothetical protein